MLVLKACRTMKVRHQWNAHTSDLRSESANIGLVISNAKEKD